MQARVEIVDGDEPLDELVSLRKWLIDEDELRGRVEIDEVPPQPGEMGGFADALIVALGSGGALAVLANSVSVWLQNRRSTISVKVIAPDGRATVITAEGIAAEAIASKLGTETQRRD